MSFKETSIGKIPVEWETYKLKDCTLKITDGTHSTVKDDPEGDFYLLSCKNIKAGMVVLGNNERRINLETLEKLRKRTGLQKNDMLLTTVGTIGEIALVKDDIVNYELQRSVAIIRPNFEKFNSKFMYYTFKERKFLKQCMGLIKGSVQKCLYLGEISEIMIPCPGIEEQKAIAKILSDLDEKIETNNKINKNLEEMAQAIFKEWFVDFEFPNEEGKPYKSSGGEMIESELGMIPKEWQIKNIESLAHLEMGVSPSSKSYNYDFDGLPLINGAADFEGKLIRVNKFTKDPKKCCKKGDMIFGVRATIGNTVFADKEYAIGRGVASLREKNIIDRELIYFSLNKEMKSLINSATGSVFVNLKKADINNVSIFYNERIAEQFNEIVGGILEEILVNDKENERIKGIRDILLPKLMSGEIRVPLDNIEN
ncbi:MAG: restriction endonuclease subunit S [Sarcina sp.]